MRLWKPVKRRINRISLKVSRKARLGALLERPHTTPKPGTRRTWHRSDGKLLRQAERRGEPCQRLRLSSHARQQPRPLTDLHETLVPTTALAVLDLLDKILCQRPDKGVEGLRLWISVYAEDSRQHALYVAVNLRQDQVNNVTPPEQGARDGQAGRCCRRQSTRWRRRCKARHRERASRGLLDR